VKTISIQEAAEALGVTAGTIQLRLQRGELKGMRSKTAAGSSEWRVFLSQRSADYAFALQNHSISFSDKDIIDPDDTSYLASPDETIAWRTDDSGAWRVEEIQRMEMLAETLLKPLTDRIEAQAVALREQATIIEEQGLQLRLIEDLESKINMRNAEAAEHQKAAETERQISECYKQENAELRHQVMSLTDSRNAKLDKIANMELELERLRQACKEAQLPWWKKLFRN
jgi:hypothetical protein